MNQESKVISFTTAPETVPARGVTAKQIVFVLLLLLCLTPLATPPLALFMGLVVAQVMRHPFPQINRKATNLLLQVSVVGLGFGMNVTSALQAGREGVLYTMAFIAGTLVAGRLLGRLLGIEKKTAVLVSGGTAICGGSAIAALAPVLGAEEKQVSVALGTVFILNSIALFLFPLLGHALQLSDAQFGTWCAIAIHDTSSVVGAAARYSTKALEVATTLKLARALWIMPVALGISLVRGKGKGRIRVPYFIGLFILAMIANTYLPFVSVAAPAIVAIAKAGLTLTLFLIGAGLSGSVLKAVGLRPLLQGTLLWVIVSVAALMVVMQLPPSP